MSLRARLAIITVLAVALALLVANFAIGQYVERFLIDRLDDDLRETSRPATAALLRGDVATAPDAPTQPDTSDSTGGESIPFDIPFDVSATYVALCGPDASVLDGRFLFTDEGEPPDLTAVCADAADGWTGTTNASSSDGSQFRVLVSTDEGSPLSTGAHTVVAMPSGDIDETLDRLLVLQILASLAVLGAVAALVWWLTGIGLRPLRRIKTTAAAIAEGDLTQRVDVTHPNTEVGELGQSLNVMLTEIETAFAAKELSEAQLRQFVADASHELRTPITAVRGYSELFIRHPDGLGLDPSTVASRIRDHAVRMGVLVEDLLLLAHLDEHRPLASEPVDLTNLAAECAADTQALDPERSIAVEADDDTTVHGDAARLAQVVGNLLSNARTYTPDGSPIEVRVRRDDGHVRLEVVDHGPGIAPELGSRVFDRFVRADPSRSRTSGGSGLGLSIVAAIIEAHDGRYGVKTTGGGGCTLWIELPVNSGIGEEGRARRSPRAPQATRNS